MQSSNTPPNPSRQMPPFGPRNSPFSPTGSPNFLKPQGPRFGQPVVWCDSTPRQKRTGDYSNNSSVPIHVDSPARLQTPTDESISNYIPLNSSTPNRQGSYWSPNCRTRLQVAPYNEYRSPGRGGRSQGPQITGPWRHNRHRNTKNRGKKSDNSNSESNPGHSKNIRDYISPRFLEDPWKNLMKPEEKLE